MSRIDELEKEIKYLEKDIAAKQEELRYKQKEYALALSEKANIENLSKFEKELKKHMTNFENIEDDIQNMSVMYLSAKNEKEKDEIGKKLSLLYNKRDDEDSTIKILKTKIESCEKDLSINKNFQREHFLKIALDTSEEQPQPQ